MAGPARGECRTAQLHPSPSVSPLVADPSPPLLSPAVVGAAVSAPVGSSPVGSSEPVGRLAVDTPARRPPLARMVAHANPRLRVHLPVPPHDDLFARMNAAQMQVFRDKLTRLADALRAARSDADDVSTGDILRRHLGDDFPAAKRNQASIVSSGSAG